MAGPTFGPIWENPDYEDHHLFETAGYVLWINVEQEGDRQAVHFMLRIYTAVSDSLQRYHDQQFKIMLDVNTTTALAQLQLLRDAMWSGKVGFPYLVHVHFNFSSEALTWGYVYYLTIVLTDSVPITVHDFRGRFAEEGWFYHDE